MPSAMRVPDGRHRLLHALAPAAFLLRLSIVQAVVPLPGVNPHEYNDDERVEVRVNKLTSFKTQLPYDYYELKFCKPDKPEALVQNLGEILKGDKIQSTLYEVKANKNETCKVLCTQELSGQDRRHFQSYIEDYYMVNLMIDGLPAVTPFRQSDSNQEILSDGFPVGVYSGGHYYLHNHVEFNIQYHMNKDLYQGLRVVRFEVIPYSQEFYQVPGGDDTQACRVVYEDGVPYLKLDADDIKEDEPQKVRFTYNVRWTWSDTRWAMRWDVYKKMAQGSIHWFAITNSLMIVLFLSAMVAMILLRTLHRDINQYNDMTKDEVAEETGWKLVHGDVFRKPPYFTILAVSVGSGAQLLGMSVVTLILAMLNFLTPQHRGALLQSMLLLFTIMGALAGYVAARMVKLLDESVSKSVSLLTALLYPGIYFSVFFCLNLLIWEEKSSGAVTFSTLFTLLILWFGISVPLVLLGFRAGFRSEAVELPVKTSAIPREIPQQVWYTHPAAMCMAGGLLSFSAIFTELFFIMSSLWQHHFYYLFSFLALVLVILIIMCSEVSIALTYFQLTAGDYRWWWQSFFASGSAAIYVMVYSVIYFWSRLQIDRMVSTILYFAYMGIASTMFGLLTGSIGVIASFYFVKAIYGSIKID